MPTPAYTISQHGRGTCTGCGQDYALRKDGTIRHHRTAVGGMRGLTACPGAGKKPKPTHRFPGDAMSRPHNEPQR